MEETAVKESVIKPLPRTEAPVSTPTAPAIKELNKGTEPAQAVDWMMKKPEKGSEERVDDSDWIAAMLEEADQIRAAEPSLSKEEVANRLNDKLRKMGVFGKPGRAGEVARPQERAAVDAGAEAVRLRAAQAKRDL